MVKIIETDDMKAEITPKPVVSSSDDQQNNSRIIASINPLVFIEADDRFKFGKAKRNMTSDTVLKYLASETFIPEMDNIKKNYDWIAKDATRLFVVPAEYKILEKMVRPLKNAIGAYIIGNSLDTISLCGTVSEMIAIFLFEINELSMDGRPLSNEKELKKHLDRFEKLGQYERVKKLLKFGLIDEEIRSKFDSVRKIRKEYLHRLSKKNDNIAPDAKESFDVTLDIFLKITGLSVKDGMAILNQKIIDYLDKKNLVEKVPK